MSDTGVGSSGYRLQVNDSQCRKCGRCERLLPGFRSKYKGLLLISATNYHREEIRCSVESVIDACHVKTISLANAGSVVKIMIRPDRFNFGVAPYLTIRTCSDDGSL